MGLVYLLFFGSGFAALVYQLLWFRHFGFVFGNTVFAATTVITAFMIGLAWGARFWGARADRMRHPLRTFALLELAVGLYAAAMPLVIGLVRESYRWAYLNVTEDFTALTGIRFGMAFLSMLIPTFLMGGTLPVLSRALVRGVEGFSGKLGVLYGVNTMGAATGIVAAGFLLLPALGLTGSNVMAVSINLAVAVGAMLLARRIPALEPELAGEADSRPLSREAWVLAAGIALSGFVALAFEVIWFRALILVFGSTTYSFCTMLGIYLLGVALGPLTLGWLADRTERPGVLFALLQLLIGVYVYLSLFWFDDQAEWLLQYLQTHGLTWGVMSSARFLIAAKFLVVPTFLMGLSFPVAAKALRAFHGRTGDSVGKIYAINTLGDIAGSLAGGFLLLPLLGMNRALVLLAGLSFLSTLVILVLVPARRFARAGLAAVAVLGMVACVVHPPVWTKEIIASGPYFSPWNFIAGDRITLWDRLNSERLVFFQEGLTATASVTLTDDEEFYFSMDGKVEADTSARGMLVQRMIGHLPMLFHPDPKVVMNLGLGAGVTFGSLSCYPVDHLEVVEIESAVTNVARIWGDYNHRVIDNPKATVTINDGRNHLFCTPRLYDVITSDPYEPVVGGASHLFTVDHFRGARARLAAGGIMCQWVPMYEMSREDYFTIIRSFVRVFPESAIFFTGVDSLLIGFRDGMDLNAENVRRKFEIPTVRDSLAEVGIGSPELLLSMYIADLREAPEAHAGRVHTDDRPVIEFSTPRHAINYTTDRNQEVLLDLFNEVPDSFKAGLDEAGRDFITRSHDALRFTLRANVLRTAGDPQGSFDLLAQAHRLAPENPVIRNELAAILRGNAAALRQAGEIEASARTYQNILALVPDDFDAHVQLVSLAMAAGQVDMAAQVVAAARGFYPDSALIRSIEGRVLVSTGRVPEGLAVLEEAARARPEKPGLWDDLARVLEAVGRPLDAEQARVRAEMSRARLFPRR
jgi:spermidine synthase